MPRRRFLLYFDPNSAKQPATGTLHEIVMQSITNTELSLRGSDDLTLIQTEPCLAVELSGPEDAIGEQIIKWQADCLRVEDADREIRELGEGPSDPPE